MNSHSTICIILLKLIIFNVITVYTNDQTRITIDVLNKLIKKYPAFIQLRLQEQDYYTGKDIARCPMPYNENTILDDPDVVSSELFNPRECEKPWTWTRQNEIEVSVPINGTVGKRLGDIIRPCLKNNTNIIQCYTHYLNVIESVGLTLIDRFCLFLLEAYKRLQQLRYNIDYNNNYSLFNITANFTALTTIFKNVEMLLYNMLSAFKRYYISTLPLDCVKNILDKMILYFRQDQRKSDAIEKHALNCRELMKSKRNYAVLDSDPDWKWDYTSDYKPDNTSLILTQLENNQIGLIHFPFYNRSNF
ncbi:uncharacterized protein LOC126902846 [Daktulosphaira vitifoliae]|uniref:uncharacterized protein LOC126902846 n=1 Tax=Daktulosphaira vitifoliae TaxID=58002 RepID=UPI0021AA919D|nr:uncharacterized protein LOC126902846 [Daktulosphaira vitifoliae]